MTSGPPHGVHPHRGLRKAWHGVAFFAALATVAVSAWGAPGSGDAANGGVATAEVHRYSLAECLALADRNHPNLWAAHARLAFVHAQLDEARWVPFSQWNVNAAAGVLPPLPGTVVYTTAPANGSNPTFTTPLEPRAQFIVSGVEPLYTFGKISSAARAAEGQVRVTDWDLEKSRQ